MPRRNKRSDDQAPTPPDISPVALPPPTKGLVFISHDTRDADLAEEFGNLLTDASGGMLRSFRSSDRKGTAGIEFGEEWYTAIMSKLDDATDVVALLTPNSLNRPWILYEVGVAKGQLDTKALGLAIGIPLEKASTGPFAQFQNCGDDEASLTGLVMQLIRRNPAAQPREEAVARQVRAFRENVEKLLKARGAPRPAPAAPVDENAVAKLFEEVKVMFRDLPEKLEGRINDSIGRRRHRRGRVIHPMMLEEILFHPALGGAPGGEGPAWLMLATLLRDDIPWLSEVAMDMYRAIRSGNATQIASAREAAMNTATLLADSRFAHEFIRHEDPEMHMLSRHLPDMLAHFMKRAKSLPPDRPRRAFGGVKKKPK